MEKTDFRKTLKHLYQPSTKDFTTVEVPVMQFAKIDGAGNPNTSAEYAHAVQWLYSVSYPLKFMSKKELGKDYTVPPLEGLWWAEDMVSFVSGDKDKWLVDDDDHAARLDHGRDVCRRRRQGPRQAGRPPGQPAPRIL